MTAQEIIELLGLVPHPAEGGFFRETYRAGESVGEDALPARYLNPRCFGTAIYYLLTPGTFSAMHKVKSDEVYHFYLGDPVEMLQLLPDGTHRTLVLGHGVAEGQHVQLVVARGVWQGSALAAGGRWALMGATVSPGFEYGDYEAGDRDKLIRKYPAAEALITRLTSGGSAAGKT